MGNGSNSALALLVGAAIGVGVGVLLAPEKGSKTREKIKDKMNDVIDELKSKVANLTHASEEEISKIKDNFMGKLDETVQLSSEKTEEVIEILEQKLQELKEKAAKYQ